MAARSTTAKKAVPARPAKKSTAKRSTAKKSTSKAAAPKRAAAAKSSGKPSTTRTSPATKKKQVATKRAGTATKASQAAKTAKATKTSPSAATKRAKAAAPAKPAVPAKDAADARKRTPFPAKFLAQQEQALRDERVSYTRQAKSLKAEADALVADFEPGDVQFDEESGEGDTLNTERERDLALSAQAQQAVDEIDHALTKFELGTYGICEVSGDPIPPERLEAIPWARERVEYKTGGLGRR